ncbi:cupin-like domain-containing protein [Sphingomonas sp. CJ20]
MAEPQGDSFAGMAAIPEIAIAVGDADALDRALRRADAPFVVRGLVAGWPLVAAGRQSGSAARDYLLARHRNLPFPYAVGAPGGGDRLFYTDAMAMNHRTASGRLPDIFAQIDAQESAPDPHLVYLASIDVRRFFDGVHEENPVPLGARDPLVTLWAGTQTRVAAHNDFPDNLACVAAGRRRFTLFPPDQFRNLYLGPLDNTPAGRAISMVDLRAPDFARYPRFREALAAAQTVVLEPGDAIHIPSNWWHHVEALDPFNILVNYWWRDTPAWLGQPQDALHLALLTIRDLPADEKRYWRDLIDHYVFENPQAITAHLPKSAQGVLAPLTPDTAGRLRAFLLRQLSR